MAGTFISYSRRDLEFVQKLVMALTNLGKETWFDRSEQPLQGIPPGSKWWDEIKYGIETTDNFLFVVSPTSIVSPYCNAEIAHAIQHDKRFVTVLYCSDSNEMQRLSAIDEVIESIPISNEMPFSRSSTESNLRSIARQHWLMISQVQYIVFSSGSTFEQSFEQLVRALDLDIAWVRMRSQIRQAARLWADHEYQAAYLWHEERLRSIRVMVGRNLADLSELERDFLRPEQERLLEELDNVNLLHQRRATIGERLNALGDYRRGIGLCEDGLPEIDWCVIGDPTKPPKTMVMIVPQMGRFEFKSPFYIARYPITYKQFQAFIDAKDGFFDSRWWEGIAATDEDRSKPGEQNFKFDNHPRESVSWYDAIAFCRWFSWRLLETLGKNPVSEMNMYDPFTWLIRLPSEVEWVVASRDNNVGSIYPWSGEWNGYLANTAESGLARTTAVGMYPNGSAPCGALDMSGNVWEWTLADRDSRKNDNITGSKLRELHGGSWISDLFEAQVASVVAGNPWGRFNDFGFRVCGSASIDYLHFNL